MELTKSDLTTGDELPGAHLKVTDEDGNVVDEWVSTEEAHVIKELVVGKNLHNDRNQTCRWICNRFRKHRIYHREYCGNPEA